MGGEDKFDFLRTQSAALPTELPGQIKSHDKSVKKRNYSKNADFYRVLGAKMACSVLEVLIRWSFVGLKKSFNFI